MEMMENLELESHWQNVYGASDPSERNWYQSFPAPSISLIQRAGLLDDAPIIDVGGGASLLVDALLERGFSDVSVLDLSSRALNLARKRLGERADDVTWIQGDVTAFLADRRYRLWHDRATFHFLTDPVDRALYTAVLYEAVEEGGWVVIGTFAPDGPSRCAGLDTCQFDGASLRAELGPGFELVHEERECHLTPRGETQVFCWTLFRRI